MKLCSPIEISGRLPPRISARVKGLTAEVEDKVVVEDVASVAVELMVPDGGALSLETNDETPCLIAEAVLP